MNDDFSSLLKDFAADALDVDFTPREESEAHKKRRKAAAAAVRAVTRGPKTMRRGAQDIKPFVVEGF